MCIRNTAGASNGVNHLLKSLNDAAPWLQLSHLDTMKLQYNEGVGGCFPMHKDSTSATGRRLTVILYLTENWQKSQAGELRLYPFRRTSGHSATRGAYRRFCQ